MTARAQAPADAVPRGAYKNLILAALGFLLTAWAWGLISPLSAVYQEQLGLSSMQQSILVAVPVLVGALGRIPVGALTDVLGARVMLPAIALLTILPVLALTVAGNSYPAMLAVGFFLGLGGTPFAAAIPHGNGWFPPAKRGFALGVIGMGMGGTAIAALLTKPMREIGPNAQFYLCAAVLAVYGVVAWLVLRDPPGRTVPAEPFSHRFTEAARQPMTWPLSGLYAVTFGGYVSFAVYLVTYLQSQYGLEQGDASLKAAGFTLVAVVFRPPGGWLSDRVGPARVLSVCLAVLVVMAAWQAFAPPLYPWATLTFLAMAAMLGAGAGAVFSLVAQVVPGPKVGAVTGIVGAMGGLGGFVPPLVMGAVYGATGRYTLGLLALAVVALGALAYSWTQRNRRPAPAGRAPAAAAPRR